CRSTAQISFQRSEFRRWLSPAAKTAPCPFLLWRRWRGEFRIRVSKSSLASGTLPIWKILPPSIACWRISSGLLLRKLPEVALVHGVAVRIGHAEEAVSHERKRVADPGHRLQLESDKFAEALLVGEVEFGEQIVGAGY